MVSKQLCLWYIQKFGAGRQPVVTFVDKRVPTSWSCLNPPASAAIENSFTSPAT